MHREVIMLCAALAVFAIFLAWLESKNGGLLAQAVSAWLSRPVRFCPCP